MTSHTPRLHMGCGESLRSRWLPGGTPKVCRPVAKASKPKQAGFKPGRARG